VSGRGLIGAAGGAALIGVLAWIGWEMGWLPGVNAGMTGAIAVTAGGFAGSLMDSLLGATVQDQRWCDSCNKHTEARVHRCGTVTRSIRGIGLIDNDVVNITCAASGAIVAWLLMQAFA